MEQKLCGMLPFECAVPVFCELLSICWLPVRPLREARPEITVCVKSGMFSIFFDRTKIFVVSWDKVVHQVCNSICSLFHVFLLLLGCFCLLMS